MLKMYENVRKGSKAMSEVYVFFATGFEEIEGLTCVDLMRRADIDVTTVSVTGEHTVVGSHKIPVQMDKLFDEVDFGQAKMLVLPGGGPGTKNLEHCEEFEPLMKQIDAFVKEGKAVAAICAAPSILGHRGHLNGKNAICFPGFEEQLMGATIVEQGAVRDGQIITGRGMGASVDFGLAIVEFFKGKEAADALAKKICYVN